MAQRLEWPSLPEGLACPVVKAPSPRPRRLDWAALLARTFGESLLDCPCGGRRAIVAFVPDPEHARQVLHDLGLEVSEPRLGKARDPPQMDMFPLPPDDGADPVYPDD